MLTTEQARKIIVAGEARAARIGAAVNIAVLDAAAHQKAFSRMDGADLGAIEIAVGKARTAALFGMRTEDIGAFCRSGGAPSGPGSGSGGLVVFAGGVPIRNAAGKVIGAVGISGGAVAQDSDIAEAAAAAAGD